MEVVMRARQALAKYLTTLAVAANLGFAEPEDELLSFPSELFVQTMDSDDLGPDDRIALLRLLARDPRAEVRAEAAEALADVLVDVGPLARIELISDWSLAPEAPVRATLADALARPCDSPAAA